MSIRQKSSQTVTEFAETIRQKLKQLTDKVKDLYEAPSVQRSFLIEHEKMAVRAFKEGLAPPLRYRIITSNETTFDKIRQLALEEEPFIQRTNFQEPSPREFPSNRQNRQYNQPNQFNHPLPNYIRQTP